MAVPLASSAFWAPAAAVGSAIVWSLVPAGEYSSRNTGFPVATRFPVPLPTRYTTTLPAVNGAAAATEASNGSERQIAARSRPKHGAGMMFLVGTGYANAPSGILQPAV